VVSNIGDDHVAVGGTKGIKCSSLEKKKEKNKKLKTKVYLVRSFLVCTQYTIEGVSDLGLIVILLRGVKLVLKCGCQSATRCSNSFLCIRM
jgi:hypothetical protein